MKITMTAAFKLYKKNKTTGCFHQVGEDDFDSVCPGGFTFEVGGKAIPFDWDASATSEENGIFTYESGYGPFFNDFEIPDYWDEDYKELGLTREDITAKLLASVNIIREFYINLVPKGEDGDVDFSGNDDPETDYVVELLEISFTERDTSKTFKVKKKVLREYNGKIISYDLLLKRAYRQYKKDWCESRGYDYKEVQKAYRRDEAYNGEMYVCLDEFEDCEFSDDDYMAECFPDFFDMKIVIPKE